MQKYTQEQLKEILAKHAKWLADEEGGKRANLRGADLSGADLIGADLCRANLSGADLSGADLCRADLSGADLCRANLSGADLRGAYLIGADLCRANLSGADLSGADLCRADLIGADLCRANLSGADLRGAYLCRADLSGANLRGAEMGFNANFASTLGQPIYQCSCGFSSRNATLTLYAKGEPAEWLFFTGCFKGTEAELRAAVAEKHGNTPLEARYTLAIDYLLAIAESNRVAESPTK